MSAENTPKYPATDPATLPAAAGNSESQFNYNATLPANVGYGQNEFDYDTASHAGLHSNYSLAVGDETGVRPTRWPAADLPRMPEPMPAAFDAERFDTLGLSEDVKPTGQTKPGPNFSKSAAEEEKVVGEEDTTDWGDSDLGEPPPYSPAGTSEPRRNLHVEEWENAKNEEDQDSGDAHKPTRFNPSNGPKKSGFFRRLLVIVFPEKCLSLADAALIGKF
jgi:hypothetical protein